MPCGQPRTPAVAFFGVAELPSARAEQDLDRERAQRRVDDPARKRSDAVEAAVSALRAVADRGADEPPEPVAAETDRDER